MPFPPRPFAVLLTALVMGGAVPPLVAQEPAPGSAAVFRQYGDRVVKIEIAESGSAAKSTLGSGFYVSADGDVITNYHVVAQVVNDPERYRARILATSGDTLGVTLLAIDVVHDLALVRASRPPAHWFALADATPEQGDRLFSLGHPLDLGLSIVEGTYNGLLEHSLYPKIHFTGALNPGMSGGPAITALGAVIGINVSTDQNEVSFLVPVSQALALYRRAREAGFTPPADFVAEAGKQILAHQDAYLRTAFQDPIRTVTIGRFTVPTAPAPFFKCWADANRDPDRAYETVNHECSTDDVLYLSEDQQSGIAQMSHRVISNRTLNRFQFAALYRNEFSAGDAPLDGDEHAVTSYRCVTRNVERERRVLRTAFCARRYRKMEGLYDVVVRAAAIGTGDQGLVTTLSLAGVSYENAEAVTRRFLESITWTR